MSFLLLSPVCLSFLVIGAHFYRAGLIVVAILCLLTPFVLFYRKPISVRIVQLCLFLAVVEWVRALVLFINIYHDNGIPWYRLACILGTVIVFTGCSTLVFRVKRLRRRYNLL